MAARMMAEHCATCGAETTTDGACPACMLDRGLMEEESTGPGSFPISAFGDYELLEEIARGGMGVVYKARQKSLSRLVAIKMILAGKLAGKGELQRFKAEAETAARLQHPNIVAIHEVGEVEGQPFFSMDYVEGQSLAELARNEPMPAKRAAAYLKTIAEAVSYAHSKGVLHRDLKPSNILIDQNDQPRITDFGLAKRLDDPQLSTPDPQLTLTGQVLGSPNFMPPEQATGNRKAAGPASDVYSLGAILYQLLTGRPPFIAETLPEALRMVAESEPVAPRLLNPSAPRDLETICLKCLRKESPRRYASAQALADDLSHFLRDEPILARPISPSERAWHSCRRHPTVASLGALVVALLLTVAMGSMIYISRLKTANGRSTESLREAYYDQAQATRFSGQAGRRAKALSLLSKAARIRPSIEIRNEVIACLALEDLEPVERIKCASDKGLAFDRDYRQYAIPDSPGHVTVHRVKDDAELARIGAPPGSLSPDGRYLISAQARGSNSAFQVYDLAAKAVAFSRSNCYLRNFDFGPNDSQVFLALNDPSTITRCSLPSGNEQEVCRLSYLAAALVLSPDGKRLAISSEATLHVEIRDSKSGELLNTLAHPGFANTLDWHPDGRLLAAGCSDGSIHIWDIIAGQKWNVLSGHERLVSAVWFSHDGNRLASASWDNTLRLWNIWTGRSLLSRPSYGLLSPFSADDRQIAVPVPGLVEICAHAPAREWRALYPRPRSPKNEGGDCAWSEDGRLLVSGDSGGIRLWNPTQGREVAFPLMNIGQLFDLAFDPSGSNVVAATSRGLCAWPITWEKGDGGERCRFGSPWTVLPDVVASSLEMDRAGTVLAAQVGGKIRILSWPDGRDLQTLALEDGLFAWALSPGGRFCAAWPGNSAGIRRVWEVASGAEVRRFDSNSFYGAAFTPDDRLLITGTAEEYEAWDTRDWTRRWKLDRVNSGGNHARIALSRDGSLGALTLSAQTILLFEPSTGRELATLEAPEPQALFWLAFNPEGTCLAAKAVTRAIHLWDLRLIRQELDEMKLDWDSPPFPPQRQEFARSHFELAGPYTNQPQVYHTASDVPPRTPDCNSNQVDLSDFFNASLAEPWFNPAWDRNDLASLPGGVQVLDGIHFDIRGVVQLASSHPWLAAPYPQEISGVPVKLRSVALHFLHATAWAVQDNGDIGGYVIHYEDGKEISVPLQYGKNVGNWWVLANQVPPLAQGTTVAWRGRNPASEREGYDLVLYHFRWENPRPDSVILSLNFRSAMTQSAPFLIGITAE